MNVIKSIIALILLIGTAGAITGSDLVQPVYDLVCLFKDVVEETIGALAAMFFVYAGIKWLLSEETEEKLLARDIMIHVLIGLILLAIVGFIVLAIFPGLTLSCI